jgi:hypothetical protein
MVAKAPRNTNPETGEIPADDIDPGFDFAEPTEFNEEQVQLKLEDVKGEMLLIAAMEEATQDTAFGKTDVYVCRVIRAETDPAVLYDRVLLFWEGIKRQLLPNMGTGRWTAGRLKKGTVTNPKQWWMEAPKASDRKALQDAINNAVDFRDVTGDIDVPF